MLQGLYLLSGRRATLQIIHRLYRRVPAQLLDHSASVPAPRLVQQWAEELAITQDCVVRVDNTQQLTVLFGYF